MNKVSVIAQMNIDMIFSEFSGLPKLGEEVISKQFDIQLGGGPQVIPLLLSRLGVAAKLGVFLTDDQLSRLARGLLEDYGFTDYVNLYKGDGRPVVITSVFSFPHDRSFLGYNEHIDDGCLSDDDVYDFHKGADICFAPSSEHVLKRLQQDGTLIVFDTGWHDDLCMDKYKRILKYTDIFTPNDKEAMRMADTDTPEEAALYLADYVKQPIVKLGKNGCITVRDKKVVHVEAVNHLVPVDTTGAGDNFLTGLIYGVCRGWDITKCMQMANVAGGYSTTAVGCFKAGLTEDKAMELMKYYEKRR